MIGVEELALSPKVERFVLKILAWMARTRAKWAAIEVALKEAERKGVNTKPKNLRQTSKMLEEIGKLEKEGELEEVFRIAFKEFLERETKALTERFRKTVLEETG